MKTLITAALFTVIATPAMAVSVSTNHCSLDLKDDLLISPTTVQLQRSTATLWQIDPKGQLWLNNQPVSTDPATRQLLQQYQSGIRQQSQETVLLVADALQLATDAIEQVVAGFGVESAPLKNAVDHNISQLKNRIDHLVVRQGEHIQINGSHLNQGNGNWEAEFEQAIEQSVAQLTGAVMISVGQAMMQGEGSFEQRMETFGKKMENFGENIEQQMQQRGQVLEQRGIAICTQLQQLDRLEGQIQQAIPAMAPFDLIDVSGKNAPAKYTQNL